MRTILIVDDQSSVLMALSYAFSILGYTVVVANGGKEALALAASQPIDAALVDLHMPQMDGVAVCRSLCDLFRDKGARGLVWVMTGARTSDWAVKAKEAGAQSLLQKPFDYVALANELEILFSSSQ